MTPPSHIGRYRILGLLGQGAMGTVYRARDESLERDVALKVMALGQADADARARFLREASAAGRLQHPNIVTIYELGEHEGSPFMALELLEGIDLQRAIGDGIRPDPKVTLPIVLQTLAGLGHAHENGIVHRDVKPSNIFLPRSRPAKIMDFGVARLVGGATIAGLVVGTPHYMSPEQVKAGDIDGRSDLFSAGLILYELVTGEKAYQGDTIVTLLYKIVHEPPNLDLIPKGPQWERLNRVLARAAEKDPDHRYPDAAAMASELTDALVDLGGSPDWTTRSDQALMVRTRAGSRAPEATVASVPTAPSAAAVDGPPEEAAPVASRLPLAIAGALGVGAVGLLAVAVWLTTRPGQPGQRTLLSPQSAVSTARESPAPAPATTSVVTVRASSTSPSEPSSTPPRPGPPAPREPRPGDPAAPTRAGQRAARPCERLHGEGQLRPGPGGGQGHPRPGPEQRRRPRARRRRGGGPPHRGLRQAGESGAQDGGPGPRAGGDPEGPSGEPQRGPAARPAPRGHAVRRASGSRRLAHPGRFTNHSALALGFTSPRGRAWGRLRRSRS